MPRLHHTPDITGELRDPEHGAYAIEDGVIEVDDAEVAADLVGRHRRVEWLDEPPENDDGEAAGAENEVAVESPPIDPADHTVDELRDALDDADYDWNAAALRGLLDAERSGKDRDTATDAIQAALNDHADEEE